MFKCSNQCNCETESNDNYGPPDVRKQYYTYGNNTATYIVTMQATQAHYRLEVKMLGQHINILTGLCHQPVMDCHQPFSSSTPQ